MRLHLYLILLALISLNYSCGASYVPASSPVYQNESVAISSPSKVYMQQESMPMMSPPPSAQYQQKIPSQEYQNTKNINVVEVKASTKVIYQGLITLRVKQLRETLDVAVKKIEAHGGFVESMGSRSVILRIPVAHFDQSFHELLSLGLVVQKSIDAIDISAQYSDLEAHLQLSKDSRERLIKLLENTTAMDQRLAILGEIKRLTDEIEQMTASLEAFKHHLSYSTITLNLIPYFEGKAIEHRSPFAWVKGLQPAIKSLDSDQDDFQIVLPKQFVKFEKKKEFEAISAKGGIFRLSRIDHRPIGNLSFWVKAIEYEFLGRGDKINQQIKLENHLKQPIHLSLYESSELNPYYFACGILLKGEDLVIIELYFPNKEAKDNHFADVLDSLKTLVLK